MQPVKRLDTVKRSRDGVMVRRARWEVYTVSSLFGAPLDFATAEEADTCARETPGATINVAHYQTTRKA